MAYRVKEILLLLLVCVLAGAATSLVDPTPVMRPSFGERTPKHEEFERLKRDVRRMNSTLRRYAIVDTAEELLSATSERMLLPAGGPADLLAQTVRRDIGTDDLKARIVVLMLPPDFGTRARMENVLPPAAEFVMDSLNGEPWCTAAHYNAETAVLTPEWVHLRLLGPCAFWGKYGAPGAQLRTWLADGGYRFAELPADYVDYQNQLLDGRDTRSAFGSRGLRYSASLEGNGCQTGRESACQDALFKASDMEWWYKNETLPGSPETYTRYRWGDEIFGEADGTLLAEAEKEFGSERFAKFWSSNEPVEQAFASAFGVSLDKWVRDWAQARYGVEPTGPRMSLVNILLALLATGMFMGVTLLIVQRREAR